MHRIDTKTAQKDKFGAGKNGFTRGNPQTGTPATDLDDDYFDMLQEELCSVVEASGASLEKERHDQLLTALRALLLSRKNPFGDIKSDGTVKTALENLGIGETGKYDILPASRGGTGASTIAGALINFGLSDLVTAGLVQVESGTDFITAKIPFLSGGSKRFLMIHAIKATMPANNNGYNLTVTFPTAYDNAPIPILGSTVGLTSTTGGTTESMNISSVTKSGCIISSVWQTWSEGPVYLLTIGGVAA
ncbi:hypothetical protein BL954_004518 [Escherichia coli]|uniref:hypothetical protein n=1 Tax=Escherichia coli TaxID=562 RepID=UPI0017BCA13E|nr:hypothetical protein [Escherichia coli]EFE0690441.1 hypothetical protein [Escherichia coli]